MTGILSLIGSALGLTGTILKYIKDSRGWEIKKDIENLLEKINVQENIQGDLRDDQGLAELYDALNIKLRVFSSFLSTKSIREEDI